jgi:hypothetical protein
MITKTSKPVLVDFLATSPRLAHAYRSAAKWNKSLARSATMHELGHSSLSKVLKHVHEMRTIMLSHADDDHFVFAEARAEPLVSQAFHVLFAESATRHNQVAQWMRRTNIRAEHRLHVATVEDLESQEVYELLARICSAFSPESTGESIVDAYVVGDSLDVRGKDRILRVPISKVPALRSQDEAVLRNFHINPDGSFVYWPDIDVHLGWNQFLQAVDPTALHKAQQRSGDYNRRYGAAIRKVREQAGLLQAKVGGLAERQLRRIERGECRATSNALRELAKAHGVDVNTYMQKVANALS